MNRHVLRLSDLDAFEVTAVLDLAESSDLEPVLAGAGAALVFEHPSARTRNAAEMAVVQLGGHPVTIRGEEVGFDRRESVEDVARTLACFHSLIAARVASHRTLERMAAALDAAGSAVLVVNLLSDYEHPTQALADLLTIRQCFGALAGRRLAYIGDANNVCRSLLDACALTGVNVRVASPEGYELGEEDLARARELGGTVERVARPEEAAEGADVLYTDVWVSMGEEAEAEERRRAFRGFMIDEALLARAGPDAVVLHCLPAHRGEEIADGVLEGPASRVWQQAENRMHAMRGLFALLFRGGAATVMPGASR
ncbi:MAG TPA: ornithine carbamoyltransferase [Acidimicrobiales bacterium]|nr:ornithine carbamoyltransferase [Acidimicrobiales bacterium]